MLCLISAITLLTCVGCSKGDTMQDTPNLWEDSVQVEDSNLSNVKKTKNKSNNQDIFSWKTNSAVNSEVQNMNYVGSYSGVWRVYEQDGKYFILNGSELTELQSSDGVSYGLGDLTALYRSEMGTVISFQFVNDVAVNIPTKEFDISEFKKDLKLSSKNKTTIGDSGYAKVVQYDATKAKLYNLETILETLGESPVAKLEGFDFSIENDSISITRNAYFSADFGSTNYSISKPMTLTCKVSDQLEVFTDDNTQPITDVLYGGTNRTYLVPLRDDEGIWVTDDFLQYWLGIYFEEDADYQITNLKFSQVDDIVSITEQPFIVENTD